MTTLITLNFFCPSKKRDPTDSFGEENEEPSLGKGTSVSVLADNSEHACTVQCVNALYCTKSSDMMILSILLNKILKCSLVHKLKSIQATLLILFESLFIKKKDFCALPVGEKFTDLLRNLRYFRIFIGLWNIIMMICMVL